MKNLCHNTAIIGTLVFVVVSASTTFSATKSVVWVGQAKPFGCNGFIDFSTRRYNEVAQIMTHNSKSVRPSSKLALPNIVANQNRGIRQQLRDGIRAFKLPIHPVKGQPWVTHTLQKREVEEHISKLSLPGVVKDELKKLANKHLWKVDTSNIALANVLVEYKNFLDANPNDILTLVLNIFDFEQMQHAFLPLFKSTGISEYLHVQSPKEPWPFLHDMIKKNTRMVVFVDERKAAQQPGLHYSGVFIADNEYNYKNAQQLNNDRCQGMDSASLYRLNHFVTPSLAGSISQARKVNTYESIKGHIERCGTKGRKMNFINVDFYDIHFDQIKKIVNELNQR